MRFDICLAKMNTIVYGDYPLYASPYPYGARVFLRRVNKTTIACFLVDSTNRVVYLPHAWKSYFTDNFSYVLRYVEGLDFFVTNKEKSTLTTTKKLLESSVLLPEVEGSKVLLYNCCGISKTYINRRIVLAEIERETKAEILPAVFVCNKKELLLYEKSCIIKGNFGVACFPATLLYTDRKAFIKLRRYVEELCTIEKVEQEKKGFCITVIRGRCNSRVKVYDGIDDKQRQWMLDNRRLVVNKKCLVAVDCVVDRARIEQRPTPVFLASPFSIL